MKRRRALRVAAVVVVVLSAVGIVVGAAGAAGSSTLPQGFRYAAEIQATVHYDGAYSIHQTGYQRCPTGEGETKVPTREDETLHIARTATFSHITVPVATPHELGKAAAKLGLKPTITTPGKISQDYSTLDIEDSLVVPNPEAEGCKTESVNCHWDLRAAPGSGIEEIAAHDFGDQVFSWDINLLGVNQESGEPCSISSGSDALTGALANSRKLYPNGLTNFPEVVVSRALGGDFHKLLHQSRVGFNPPINAPASGASNCSVSLSEEAGICSHSVTGTADVQLHRLFFYKTKQAYPR